MEDDEWTNAPVQTHRTASPVPTERNWSRNKVPTNSRRRASRASSEVSRIESILSEIDGIKLRFELKPASRSQRRTASESDAACKQLEPKIDAQKGLTSNNSRDAKAIKLAKARLKTQRRNAKNLQSEPMKENAMQR